MGAGLGLEMLLVAIVDQRVEAIDAFDDDVAAAPAIAAIGAAELDEFFAQERYGAGAAVAGADIDLGLVEKFHFALAFQTLRVMFGVDMLHLGAARKAEQG